MAGETILVTGATGQQGGVVARYLLQEGVKVRVLTRRPAKADALKKLGAEVAVGDLTDKESLQPPLRGVRKVFLVTTPFEAGLEAEVRQGIGMIDAAKEAGVEQLVFSSVGSANRNTGIPHFETKWQIERHLKQADVPATILRPVFFMENFTAPWMLPSIRQGKVVLPLPADRKLQMIALDDIGAFGAAAFIRPKEFLGEEIDLAGDALTMPEALELLAREIGKAIRYEPLPIDQAEKTLGHDAAVMYRWFNEVGYSVDIPALEKRWAIPLTKFRELVTTEAYQRRLQPKAA
ncbi:MAG: NmrA/HSCARG family protein [Candidatus Manganitrophus sp.]|nr:MAG: NmrA/HSCARG family protein [Candidatus Manganitrophus sp.]